MAALLCQNAVGLGAYPSRYRDVRCPSEDG